MTETSPNSDSSKNEKVGFGKIIRIVSIILIVVVIFGVIIVSSVGSKPTTAEKIWDESFTIGNKEAKNHFITYTDIVCPYCVAFENAIIEHEDDFEQYIEANDILFEVRLSDFLYLYGQFQTKHSKYSAVAAYCARDEGRFWDYYRYVIPKIWKDYFEKYGKEALTKLDGQPKSYWADLAHEVGFGETFDACYENEAPLQEITEIADKTMKQVDGLPAFRFNNYSPPGFNLTWGWEYVQMFFDEGLKSK